MRTVNVAIVGATGLVGSTLLQLFEENKLPIQHLYVLASQQSAGKTLTYKHQTLEIEDLAAFDFSQTQIAFFLCE